MAVAALDGRIYAIGGRVDGSYSRNLSTNEAYDPATNRWERRAHLPTAHDEWVVIVGAICATTDLPWMARENLVPEK